MLKRIIIYIIIPGRKLKMSIKEKTIAMKRWAVVGATSKRYRYAYKIVGRLIEKGYKVYPINPKEDEVDGLNVYNRISEIPGEIDVIMIINPNIGIEVLREAVELGIKYVWLQPGARSNKIRSFTKENKFNVIEDCIYDNLN
jgi:uncharacterized protein